MLKKRRRIQQKKRKTDRTPLRWRINLTDQTYDTEEVFIFVATRYLVSHIVQLTVLNCCSVLGSLALLLFRREFVPWIFHLALSCISDKGDDPTAGSSYSWDVACYQLVTEMYQVPGMRWWTDLSMDWLVDDRSRHSSRLKYIPFPCILGYTAAHVISCFSFIGTLFL